MDEKTLTLLVPAALVAGSWLVAKVLRVSIFFALLFGSVPLALPHLDLPLNVRSIPLGEGGLIGIGWAALALVAGGLVAVRLFLSSNQSSSLQKIFTLGLVGSLGFVTLLMWKREVIEQAVPGWQGHLGLVCFALLALGATFAFVRFAKSAVLFVLWAGGTFLLGSELFLHKLPGEYWSDSFKDFVSRISASAAPAEPRSGRSIKVTMLASSEVEDGVGERVERLLEKLPGSSDFELQSVASEYGTLAELEKLIFSEVLPEHPDVLLLGLRAGWHREDVEEMGGAVSALIAGTRAASESRLTQVAAYVGDRLLGPSRVSGTEKLRSLVQTVRAAGTKVVFFDEPLEPRLWRKIGEDSGAALSKVAGQTRSSLAPVQEAFEKNRYQPLFDGDTLLTDRGQELLSEVLVRSVASYGLPRNL